MYLAWFDADRKKPVGQKIAEARERYVEKFGRQPAICLVNPADAIDDAVVELRPVAHIGRHCFWIGFDEADEPTITPLVPAEPAVALAEPQPLKRPRKSRNAATAGEPPAAKTIVARALSTQGKPEAKQPTPTTRRAARTTAESTPATAAPAIVEREAVRDRRPRAAKGAATPGAEAPARPTLPPAVATPSRRRSRTAA